MAVSAIQVLHALDGGACELDQVIALLRAADCDPLRLPLAAGDRALVEIVAALTGSPIELTAACPECGEINEIAVGPTRLRDHEPRCAWLGPGMGVREPTYGDLIDLPVDERLAAEMLCERCSIGAVPHERASAAIDDIDASLAGPIDLDCVQCESAMVVDADVEPLALARLSEIAAGADRDVHLLAAFYSWDLDTIESLPDARRRRLARLIEAS